MLHSLRRVAGARHATRWHDGFETAQVVGREGHLLGSQVFFEPLGALGAGNGDDVLALGQHPGNGQLGRRAAFGRGQHFELVNQLPILAEVLALETWHVLAVILPPQTAAVRAGAARHALSVFTTRPAGHGAQ